VKPTEIIVKFGADVTDISVLSSGKVIYSRAFRVAANEMDEVITQYIKSEHQLLINKETAITVRKQIGSALPINESLSANIDGYDLATGAQRSVTITNKEVSAALSDCVLSINNAVCTAVSRSFLKVSDDSSIKKVTLIGDSILRRMAESLSMAIKLPISVRDN
jgi:rod shape-determining protein MreB